MSSVGIGALSATLYLASRRSAQGLIKLIPAAAVSFGLGITAFALFHSFTASIFCLFLAGFSMMSQIASSNTIIQTIVDEDKRGRVMSFYAVSFLGVMPFGSLLAGSIAGKIGVQNTLILGAGCCIVGALIFASKLPMLVEGLRPVFARIESCRCGGETIAAPVRSEIH
jgi:MFS family permease